MTVLKSFIVYTRGEKERQRLEEHHEQKINLQNLTFTFLSIHAKNLKILASPEEDSNYEQQPDHSSNTQALYDQHFPAIAKTRPTISPTPNNATTYAKRGWAIAASSLPVPISNAIRNVLKHPQLSHLEISGELPDFLNSVHGVNFFASNS